MGFSKGIKRLGVFSALSATLVLASACSGISQADLDAAKAQATAQEKKAADFQKELASAQQKLAAKDQEIAAAKKKALPEGISMLVGSKLGPPRPPAATPTPLPPGAQPPPPRKPPASYSEPVGPFAFFVETLTSSHGTLLVDGKNTEYGSVACTGSTVFSRGMNIVYRFDVIDTKTGKRVIEDPGTKVTVKVGNLEPRAAHFSQRAGGRVPDAPWMWATAVTIPMDHPLGYVGYTITVSTPDGRTATWTPPFLVSPPGGADTRLLIIE